MTRHEFLAALHELLRPQTYLEIGVQAGLSLSLAAAGTRAIAVDPAPAVCVPIAAHTHMHNRTSDEFFADPDCMLHLGNRVDLAFIDGMHLAEFALRDFAGVERYVHAYSVIAFDDVLPRNQAEASRVQCAGDWTGDVWRVTGELRRQRPWLRTYLVDTAPTGILLVFGFTPGPHKPLEPLAVADELVPDHVLDRSDVLSPKVALEWLASRLAIAPDLRS